MPDYQIPQSPVTIEQYVKKSQFICHLAHTPGREKAMEFIRQITAEHAAANHNCWAFVAGAPDDASCWGMNDDGEPKGCAGKPMFNVLHHYGAGEICAVVTRYFGGIKLGTGGMARAYSSTVRLALEEMQFTLHVDYARINLVSSYDMQRDIDHFIHQYNGKVISTEYGEQVYTTTDIPVKGREEFLRQVEQVGKGRISISQT